jgi:hypothetical protein
MSSFFKEPRLKLTPAGANAAEKLTYLTDMIYTAIKYEEERKRYTSASLANDSGIVLTFSHPMPEVDPEHLCGFSRELMAE